MNVRKWVLVGSITLGAAVPARAVRAQAQLDLHGSYSHAVTPSSNSWGAGVALPYTWGSKQAPVRIGTAPAFDYMKQSGGPSQPSVSLDVTAQPGGDSKLTPYAGGSASAN